ncbi:MAG: AmmeMemoRadiSam system protein A [Spirochaetes bacterium]|nr:AmmeMemoRadiSam system protein A [Spirochaetota bacterium]
MQELNKDQKLKLLKLARKTIYENLSKNKFDGPSMDEFTDTIYKTKCGAFVTIHINGSLRGCIGYIEGIKTIPETVIDMSKASAFRDPRFTSLTMSEYENIDIEISVLSPIEEVKKISEIVVGRDGLIISGRGRSGLLLPQVATENNWNLTQFLEHTCYKAGLPSDAWKQEDTKIEKFSAQVFGEKEMGII